MNLKRGFTLIELAIVIVIAGILAAIAVPIYMTLVEQAKWTEAEGIAATIESALGVTVTRNGGNAGEVVSATFDDEDLQEAIGLDNSDIDGSQYFSAGNIHLAVPNADTAPEVIWTITIAGRDSDDTSGAVASTESGAPRGYYEKIRNQTGQVHLPE